MREIDSLYNIVCEHFKQDIAVRKRTRPIHYMRVMYCAIARELIHTSLAEIGRRIGRDHATVLHATKVHEQLYDPKYGDEQYQREFDKVFKKAAIILNKEYDEITTKKSWMVHELINMKEDYKKLQVAYEEIKGVTIGDEAELKVVNLFRELSEKEKGEALMQIETKVKVSKTRQTA